MAKGGLISIEQIQSYKVVFNLIPVEAIIVIKNLNEEVQEPIDETVYFLKEGIYEYSVTAEGYISKENIRLEVYQNMTLDIQLQKDIKVPPFSEATEEEIEEVLNAHYNGDINISDYWHIGDTRLLNFRAIASNNNNSTSHIAQNITIIIIDFNHDDLVEPIGTRTKAAITVQVRETFGNKGSQEDIYYWGSSSHSVADTDNWSASPIRKWLQNRFLTVGLKNSILPNLMKTVIKKNLKTHTGTTVINTEEKVFLLSFSEVSSDGDNASEYLGDLTSEGTTYEYYKDNQFPYTNRIKYANNNGEKNNASTWWLRSPSSMSYGSFGYYWCTVADDSNCYANSSNDKLGLAPAFCL